jgi:hypothetical protein
MTWHKSAKPRTKGLEEQAIRDSIVDLQRGGAVEGFLVWVIAAIAKIARREHSRYRTDGMKSWANPSRCVLLQFQA